MPSQLIQHTANILILRVLDLPKMLNSRIGFNGVDFPPDKLLVGHLVFLLLGLSLHHHFLVLLHLA